MTQTVSPFTGFLGLDCLRCRLGIRRRIVATHRQADRLMYELYDLAKEETAIVGEGGGSQGGGVSDWLGADLCARPQPRPRTSRLTQRSLDGLPVLFDSIGSAQEHRLGKGRWYRWISPLSSYRDLGLARVRDVVSTSIDWLWMDTVCLQHNIGKHDGL